MKSLRGFKVKGLVKLLVVMFILAGMSFSIGCAQIGHTLQEVGKNMEQNPTAWGIGLGGLTGAGVTSAFGGDTEKNLIGAAIGAVLGGFTGNAIGQQRRMNTVIEQVNLNSSGIQGNSAGIKAIVGQLERTQLSDGRVVESYPVDIYGDGLFAKGSAELTWAAKQYLEGIARTVANSNTPLFVEGHTCALGDDKGYDNLGLSNRRAQNAANYLNHYLNSLRAQPRKITYQGFGSQYARGQIGPQYRRVKVNIITAVKPKG